MTGLGPVGVVLFLLVAGMGLPRLVSLQRAIGCDAACALLLLGVRALPPERADWGRAMLAEFDHVDGRWARLGFALGCVRATMTRPPLLALAVSITSVALGGLVGVEPVKKLVEPSSRITVPGAT
jgi:hypothetical protein